MSGHDQFSKKMSGHDHLRDLANPPLFFFFFFFFLFFGVMEKNTQIMNLFLTKLCVKFVIDSQPLRIFCVVLHPG
jgi:hypothetical protein